MNSFSRGTWKPPARALPATKGKDGEAHWADAGHGRANPPPEHAPGMEVGREVGGWMGPGGLSVPSLPLKGHKGPSPLVFP